MTISKRASGILLHVTSLPSPFGIGDLGPQSHQFIDLLSKHHQHYWSILPLNPTNTQQGNSPYKTHSAFAGNPLLISPELLVEVGLLPKTYLSEKCMQAIGRVNYSVVEKEKHSMLTRAYPAFKTLGKPALHPHLIFDKFCADEADWLDDYSLYSALRTTSDKPWNMWPSTLKNRERHAIAEKTQNLQEIIEQEKFVQFVFFSQWQQLKDHCHRMNLKVLGDLAFYVDYDSADVWAHPELFKLNPHKRPVWVAGVPPDYFSKKGQLWGTPVYDWKRAAETGFEWWIRRIQHNLNLVEVLRLDHFRGFMAYWQVPAKAKTAKCGRWTRAPSNKLFQAMQYAFPELPFVAEDLGVITPPVKEAIERLEIPGMRLLLFGFDGSKKNPHFPANHTANSVVYTGTHDTNTVKGWFKEEADAKAKENLYKCIGRRVAEEKVSFEFVKLALASKANLCIIPLQDVLGLGSEARMNCPAKQLGNWEWQARFEQLAANKFGLLKELTATSRRTL